jgi:hypothetical protein
LAELKEQFEEVQEQKIKLGASIEKIMLMT